jgi:hypothetical protein
MRKSTVQKAAALLLVLPLAILCACAPRYVGEERAEKAGLKLLRQAFGVTAQNAHVEYYERAGSSAVDNTEVSPNGTAPTQIYIVTISDPTIHEDLYYAEVDAKTGVAYYASKNEWLFSAPEKRQNASDTAGTSDNESVLISDDGTETVASNWVKRCFQKEVALISADGCCQRDCMSASRARIGYFVTFADGSLYRIGFSWPAMDLNEVQVLEEK